MSQIAVMPPPSDLIGAEPLGMLAWVAVAPRRTLRVPRPVPWGALALLALLIAYAALLAGGFATAISQPDDNGYFAQGSLLATSGRTWFSTESDAQYVGMHWLLTPSGTYISRYPPGLAGVV